jgi:hypothetical protein
MAIAALAGITAVLVVVKLPLAEDPIIMMALFTNNRGRGHRLAAVVKRCRDSNTMIAAVLVQDFFVAASPEYS